MDQIGRRRTGLSLATPTKQRRHQVARDVTVISNQQTQSGDVRADGRTRRTLHEKHVENRGSVVCCVYFSNQTSKQTRDDQQRRPNCGLLDMPRLKKQQNIQYKSSGPVCKSPRPSTLCVFCRHNHRSWWCDGYCSPSRLQPWRE